MTGGPVRPFVPLPRAPISLALTAGSAANFSHTSRSAMEVQRPAENVLRKLLADEPGAKATRDKGDRPNRGSASGRRLKILERLRHSGWPNGMQDFLPNRGLNFPVRLPPSQ